MDECDCEHANDVKSLQIFNCQVDINELTEKEYDEKIEIEEKYNELRKPLFEQRNAIAIRVPKFWLIAFLNHPNLFDLHDESEEGCLSYLSKIEVEDFENIKTGYRLKFYFEENPYFQNQILVKQFYLETDPPISESTKIHWKEGQCLIRPNNLFVDGKRSCLQLTSFFNWFVASLAPEEDEIARIIKDDLWNNPIKYYQMEIAEHEEDSDSNFTTISEGVVSYMEEEEGERWNGTNEENEGREVEEDEEEYGHEFSDDIHEETEDRTDEGEEDQEENLMNGNDFDNRLQENVNVDIESDEEGEENRIDDNGSSDYIYEEYEDANIQDEVEEGEEENIVEDEFHNDTAEENENGMEEATEAGHIMNTSELRACVDEENENMESDENDEDIMDTNELSDDMHEENKYIDRETEDPEGSLNENRKDEYEFLCEENEDMDESNITSEEDKIMNEEDKNCPINCSQEDESCDCNAETETHHVFKTQTNEYCDSAVISPENSETDETEENDTELVLENKETIKEAQTCDSGDSNKTDLVSIEEVKYKDSDSDNVEVENKIDTKTKGTECSVEFLTERNHLVFDSEEEGNKIGTAEKNTECNTELITESDDSVCDSVKKENKVNTADNEITCTAETLTEKNEDGDPTDDNANDEVQKTKSCTRNKTLANTAEEKMNIT